jgi:hypothetical protein
MTEGRPYSRAVVVVLAIPQVLAWLWTGYVVSLVMTERDVYFDPQALALLFVAVVIAGGAMFVGAIRSYRAGAIGVAPAALAVTLSFAAAVALGYVTVIVVR